MQLAVCVNNSNETLTVKETMDAIKQAGFENVFVQWYHESLDFTKEKQVEYLNKLGLTINFAHLGYEKINTIWEDGIEGEALVESYQQDIKICKENNIPMVVMHLTKGTIAPKQNKLGLERLKNIVEYAEKLEIKVAFENTKITGYLEYVLENITNKNLGICYDAGHCHVHFKDQFDYLKFKDRIFAVHLHDNDKSDDLHLLPFDGTIRWDLVLKNLKEAGYKGPTTLELCYRYDYLKMTPVEFYQKGYERGERLAEIYEKI